MQIRQKLLEQILETCNNIEELNNFKKALDVTELNGIDKKKLEMEVNKKIEEHDEKQKVLTFNNYELKNSTMITANIETDKFNIKPSDLFFIHAGDFFDTSKEDNTVMNKMRKVDKILISDRLITNYILCKAVKNNCLESCLELLEDKTVIYDGNENIREAFESSILLFKNVKRLKSLRLNSNFSEEDKVRIRIDKSLGCVFVYDIKVLNISDYKGFKNHLMGLPEGTYQAIEVESYYNLMNFQEVVYDYPVVNIYNYIDDLIQTETKVDEKIKKSLLNLARLNLSQSEC